MLAPYPGSILQLAFERLDFLGKGAVIAGQVFDFADRVKEAAPTDPAAQVDLAYRIAIARPPRAEEAALAADFLKKRSLADFTHVLLNLNEFLYVR